MDHEKIEPSEEPVKQSAFRFVELLERIDNFAHLVVAILLIVMAGTVLVHTCLLFSEQLSFVGKSHGAAVEAVAATGAKPSANLESADPFFSASLELLSGILFAVILLELLRTILTYVRTHNIQAIMQEFLVVGIISSVRKILLVGAESSLSGSKGMEFVQEASGTLILIVGIVILIVGLVLLRRTGEETRAS